MPLKYIKVLLAVSGYCDKDRLDKANLVWNMTTKSVYNDRFTVYTYIAYEKRNGREHTPVVTSRKSLMAAM